MNFPVCIAKLNWYPIMFPHIDKLTEQLWQHRLAVLELARREAEKPRTLKEMSQGGRSQPLEWAMVHTLAWKHDIAEGGKTPFYHSVRFAPSLPVKHAICPRHRSSCWLIECDRAIHTLLPIRHHLLQKKKKNHHHSTVTGCQAEGTNLHRALAERLPIWGRGQRPGVTTGDTAQAFTHRALSDWWHFSFVIQSVTRQSWKSSLCIRVYTHQGVKQKLNLKVIIKLLCARTLMFNVSFTTTCCHAHLFLPVHIRSSLKGPRTKELATCRIHSPNKQGTACHQSNRYC